MLTPPRHEQRSGWLLELMFKRTTRLWLLLLVEHTLAMTVLLRLERLQQEHGMVPTSPLLTVELAPQRRQTQEQTSRPVELRVPESVLPLLLAKLPKQLATALPLPSPLSTRSTHVT